MTTYQENVTEARSLVKRSEEDQWRLAELTWGQMEGGVSAAKWATDIEVSTSYVYRLFKMWQRHSLSDAVHKPKFSEAYNEVSPSSAPGHQHMTPEEPGELEEEDFSWVPPITEKEEEESDLLSLGDTTILLTEIRSLLNQIEKQQDRIADAHRDAIAESLDNISNTASGLSQIIRSPQNGSLSDEDLEALTKEL